MEKYEMQEQHQQTLRDSELSGNLADEHVARIAQFISVRKMLREDALCVESMEANNLFIVHSGRVAVFVGMAPESAGLKITELGRGQLFGTSAFIDDGPRWATVQCLEEGEVLAIPGNKLRQLCEVDPAIGYRITMNIGQSVASRLRAMTERVAEESSWGFV